MGGVIFFIIVVFISLLLISLSSAGRRDEPTDEERRDLASHWEGFQGSGEAPRKANTQLRRGFDYFANKKKDDDFIRYLSVDKNLEEFLWSIDACVYAFDFPQIMKYCCTLVMNNRKLSRHNKEAFIKEIQSNLAFYINIYTEVTGITKFQKPEEAEEKKLLYHQEIPSDG
jgi:hypothetical protein